MIHGVKIEMFCNDTNFKNAKTIYHKTIKIVFGTKKTACIYII